MKPMKFSAAVLSLALAFSPAVQALNVVNHRPTTGVTGGYRVHTAETLRKNQIAVGFEGSYADDFFESKIGNPILQRNDLDFGDQLGSSNFMLSYGLMDSLTFNLNLPVHFFNDINNATFSENRWDAEPGDLLLEAKARLINAKENDMGFGLALIPYITAPTGQLSSAMGDSTVTGGMKVAVEQVWDMTRLYANVGGHFRRFENVSLIDRVKHAMTYGVGLDQTLSKDHQFNFVTEVIGSTQFHSEITSPAEVNFLLRKGFGDGFKVLAHAGAAVGLGDGYGNPDWRTFGGLTFAYGGEAKQTPAPIAAEPTADDTDGDGLTDKDEAAIYGTDPKNPDTDGDGLRDGDEVKTHKTNPKDKDTDDDGLIDGAEVNDHKTNPLNKDTDADTCKDGEEVLSYKTNPLNKDCPPARIDLKGKINFRTNSAEILPDAFPVLDDAVAKMKANPIFEVVEIEGHTDSQGADAFNMDLSQRRADAVKKYFIGKGVAANRLTTKGYGETKPVASNDTAEGRGQNRRIVFSVIKFKKSN